MLQIYDHYAADVAAFLARHAPGRPWDVEELVQETFIRVGAEAARARYAGVGSFRNYIFTIARNLLLDRPRADTRREARHRQAAPDPEARGAPTTPDQAVEDNELKGLMSAFRGELDPVFDRLLTLRFADGCRRKRRRAPCPSAANGCEPWERNCARN